MSLIINDEVGGGKGYICSVPLFILCSLLLMENIQCSLLLFGGSVLWIYVYIFGLL